MNKISSLQLTAVMLCCFLTRMMTYVPGKEENSAVMIFSALLSAAAEFVILLPASILYIKNNGDGVLRSSYSAGTFSGKISAAVYLAFCLLALAASTGKFIYYLDQSFPEYFTALPMLIVFTASALYTAATGMTACSRAAAVSAALTLAGIALAVAGFGGNADFTALHLAVPDRGAAAADGFVRILARSDEAVLFVLLLPFLKEKPIKTAAMFAASKFMISALIIAAIAVIMGDYAHNSELSFLALSSFSKNALTERADAFFLLFWTACAVVTAAVIMLCADRCIKSLFPGKGGHTGIVCAAAISSAGAYYLSGIKPKEFSGDGCTALLIFAAAIPLLFLTILALRKRRSAA